MIDGLYCVMNVKRDYYNVLLVLWMEGQEFKRIELKKGNYVRFDRSLPLEIAN